jgi:hypothetical protein
MKTERREDKEEDREERSKQTSGGDLRVSPAISIGRIAPIAPGIRD